MCVRRSTMIAFALTTFLVAEAEATLPAYYAQVLAASVGFQVVNR